MKYFGTDGIRSTFEKSFLNENFSFALGEALGAFMKEQNIHGDKVLIGRDTRPSGKALLSSFHQGLKENGFYGVSAGVLPTPALAFGVMEKKMSMGVMITASHNPAQDNGFKFFSALGKKLSDSEEESIERKILIKEKKLQIIETESIEIIESYVNYISGLFPQNMLKNKKIVIDLSNGATQQTTPTILKKLGAEIHAINLDSGEINDRVGSEFPDVMSQKVKELNADFGFAHDGDGDRVIFCNSNGEVIPGDKILGLLAINEAKHNRLPQKGFVATVHSNSGLDASLKEKGISLLRADVGDRKVAEMMRKECLNLGGESSGHVVASQYLPTGDGLLTALMVTRASYESKQSIHSLSDQIILWPSVEGSFLVKEKIPIEECDELYSIFQKVTVSLGERGRILLRYSGTEPKIRLLVEAVDSKKANDAYRTIAEIIEKTL